MVFHTFSAIHLSVNSVILDSKWKARPVGSYPWIAIDFTSIQYWPYKLQFSLPYIIQNNCWYLLIWCALFCTTIDVKNTENVIFYQCLPVFTYSYAHIRGEYHSSKVLMYIFKMKSSNWNIFRVTGPFSGKFTSHRWIPLTEASDANLLSFLFSLINKHLIKQSRCCWFEMPSHSLWRHCNVKDKLNTKFLNSHQSFLTWPCGKTMGFVLWVELVELLGHIFLDMLNTTCLNSH